MNKSFLRIISVLLLAHYVPTFSMLVPVPATTFTDFDKCFQEIKSCIIDHVDDMRFIGRANKRCYAIVKDKQKTYIIQMHADQDPSRAKFNIPPFMFACEGNEQTYVINPNHQDFYQEKIGEDYIFANNADHRFGAVARASIKATSLVIACFCGDEEKAKAALDHYVCVKNSIKTVYSAPESILQKNSNLLKLQQSQGFEYAEALLKIFPNKNIIAMLAQINDSGK